MFFVKKKKDYTWLKVVIAVFAVLGALVAAWAAVNILYKKYKACLAGFDTNDDLCELEDCDCDCFDGEDCDCGCDEIIVEDETV